MRSSLDFEFGMQLDPIDSSDEEVETTEIGNEDAKKPHSSPNLTPIVGIPAAKAQAFILYAGKKKDHRKRKQLTSVESKDPQIQKGATV